MCIHKKDTIFGDQTIYIIKFYKLFSSPLQEDKHLNTRL